MGAAGADVITVGVADDEPLFTAGLAMLLDAQPDMAVAWQARDGGAALRQQRDQPADVLLLDVRMPGMDGLAATERLTAEAMPGAVVILTTFETDEAVLAAVAAGAAGFLVKSTPPEQLLDAVRTVHRGDAIISPGPTRRLFARFRDTAPGSGPQPGTGPAEPDRRALAEVTPRELEVLELIGRGCTNHEVCDRLWLSMTTVKTHIGHLLAKTHSRDRVQLVLFALRTGTVHLQDALASHPRRKP